MNSPKYSHEKINLLTIHKIYFDHSFSLFNNLHPSPWKVADTNKNILSKEPSYTTTIHEHYSIIKDIFEPLDISKPPFNPSPFPFCGLCLIHQHGRRQTVCDYAL